jgi:trans-2-enoyl-CoA reductase
MDQFKAAHKFMKRNGFEIAQINYQVSANPIDDAFYKKLECNN